MKALGQRIRSSRGRKRAQESRSTELRRALLRWNQSLESSRPSLRLLARELGTSHQLLGFHLKNLHKWQSKEYLRQAKEIRAHANAEDRALTQQEEQQFYAYNRAAMRVTVRPMLLETIKRMKQDSERRPLCRQEIKALKVLARQFPEAQEVLQKCSRKAVMKRKPFAEIVQETPRQEGETPIAWVRRIWDQCAKYDTKCPKILTVELLERYAQGSAKHQKNNLPVISAGAAKSFG
jgi:hypothetical protein